ncbi:MAG: histidine--tRNA ligase [Eubacteriales bacterium]|jgi:histidyl-tRNA synthetase|nr:histidine--tRNA ligase [Eubacteriales bacterium]
MFTKAPRGTKDITPAEVYKWHYVESKIHQVCDVFGYKEIRVPVFEHTELYERGVGDTSDVVQKEMYTFEDKGGRSITLRPEGTAGVVRAYLENNLYAEAAPAKLYYNLSCYRYEKPQAGRLREFHQFGIEAFGSASPQMDAEIISLAKVFFETLKFDNLGIFINSVGCPKCRPAYHEKLIEYFTDYKDKLCSTCLSRLDKNPMRIIDCKNPVCKEIGHKAPMIIDEQCEECNEHFDNVKSLMDAMGISYGIDPTIVRGLDYYTTTVFEIKSDNMVIAGGGRYNHLVEELGGPSIPGIGFGLGLERLIMALESRNLFPQKPSGADLYISSIGDNAAIYAQKLAFELRKEGIRCEKDLVGRSVKAQMKYADKIGARFVIVLGDDEINSGSAKLKNMETGEQTDVTLNDLSSQLKNYL